MEPTLTFLGLLCLGLAIGALLGHYLGRQKASRQFQQSIVSEQLKNTQSHAELTLLKQRLLDLQTEAETLRTSHNVLLSDKTRLETLLEDAKQQENRLALMGQDLLKQIKQEMQAELEKEFQQKQEATQGKIGELLKPLTELILEHRQKVETVEEQLDEVEKQRIDETSQLKTLIDLMSKETRRLADGGNRLAEALSNSKGRGDWGEMQLTRLLEASGLMEGVHYEVQNGVRDDSSKLLRPDVTVRFTNNRLLYIDAKTILTNLERLEHAETEADAQTERKKHVAALEKEILSLSAKAYDAKHRDSIDFIVLFVPRESMLRLALEEKPDLLEQAFHRRIVLASPLILMAILRTVSIGWQEAQLSQNAQEIHGLARELHKRAATFVERFLKIEDRLKLAMGQFDDAKTALSGRMGLISQVKKLEDYGCKSEKKLLPLTLQGDLDLPEEEVADWETEPVGIKL